MSPLSILSLVSFSMAALSGAILAPKAPPQCVLEWRVPGGGGLEFRCNSTCAAPCTPTTVAGTTSCANACDYVCTATYSATNGVACHQLNACPPDNHGFETECLQNGAAGMFFLPVCDCIVGP